MKTLPTIPRSVPHILGPIKVLVIPDLKDSEGGNVFGLWDGFQRVISVRAGMHPTQMWATLFHEQTHADLGDIGVALSVDQEEAICNAVAAARVHEMLSRRTT